jgi:hypothetical protein
MIANEEPDAFRFRPARRCQSGTQVTRQPDV